MPDYRPRLIFDIFLVNLPFPSLSEFLRLDELCPRTRNNYQSPFLPLPVKNRRKEARRGKKGETIVGERKETKRLTFTLPSRTKFPLHLPSISSTDSYRFLGNLAILSLFTQRYRNNGRQRFPLPSNSPFLSLLSTMSRIIDWLNIGTQGIEIVICFRLFRSDIEEGRIVLDIENQFIGNAC